MWHKRKRQVKGSQPKKYKKKSDKKIIEILSFMENDSTRKRKNYWHQIKGERLEMKRKKEEQVKKESTKRTVTVNLNLNSY